MEDILSTTSTPTNSGTPAIKGCLSATSTPTTRATTRAITRARLETYAALNVIPTSIASPAAGGIRIKRAKADDVQGAAASGTASGVGVNTERGDMVNISSINSVSSSSISSSSSSSDTDSYCSAELRCLESKRAAAGESYGSSQPQCQDGNRKDKKRKREDDAMEVVEDMPQVKKLNDDGAATYDDMDVEEDLDE